MISIIITTYNRSDTVLESINSALLFIRSDSSGEVIVVDDCSEDDTTEVLKSVYQLEIKSKRVKLVRLQYNLGVTGAKNSGASIASNEWIIFLDSDDVMFTESAVEIYQDIIKFAPTSSIIFFRSMSDSGKLIGRRINNFHILTLNKYIQNGTYGEALPAINKNIFLKYPYQIDLRGFEGISYFRIIKNGYKAVLSPIIARVYNESRNDRLSNPTSVKRRSKNLIRGYHLILKEGHKSLSLFSLAVITAKIFLNVFRYVSYKLSYEKTRKPR